jgi:putative ABC transport system permease protein
MNYAIETGLRGLRRHPRTMVLSIVTLALGLASVMTMLSLLTMLSADPLPGLSQQLYLGWVDSREAARSAADPGAGDPEYLWKTHDVAALVAAQPNVRQTAVVASFFNLASADGRKTVDSANGIAAIGPFGAMFGAPLLHGRFWTPQEEQSRARVVVLGSKTSLRLFDTENAVGRQVRLGQDLFQVIGIVAPWQPRPRFYFMQPGNPGWSTTGEEVFVPAQAALEAKTPLISERTCDDTATDGYQFNAVDQKACRWLALWAELQAPRQVEDYRAALLHYAQDRHAAGAFARPAHADLYSVQDWLAANRVVPADVRLNLWLASGLLALCLVNVAGLLAARFLRRSSELGVRRVLGAPRRAIFIACLVESGAAGLVGGLLALPLTLGGLWLVRQQAQDYAAMAHFKPALFAVLVALAIVTGTVVGLLPAWRATRMEPALQVKTL